MESVTLKVKGMSCEHCVKAVNDALVCIAGVGDVSVDLKYGAVSFDHNPKLAPLQKIIDAITDEGFDVIG